MSDNEDVGLEPHGVRDCVVWLVAHAKDQDRRMHEGFKSIGDNIEELKEKRIGPLELRMDTQERKTILISGAFATIALAAGLLKDEIKGRLGIR